MSNVVRTDIDALNAVVTVTLPKEEYSQKVQQDIKKYSQRAAMKGFRPGKTPQSLVKKMYGNAFLMDTVNELVQEKLGAYLDEEKIDMLGQPIPTLDQPKNDLDIKNPQDLVFKFDIGLSPQFEVKGLDGTFEVYAVEAKEDDVKEELDSLRRRMGAETEIDTNIEDNDLVTLKIKEVGGSLENTLVVSVNWLTDDMKSVFLTQKKGDQLQINIFQLEKDSTTEFVRKHFLGLSEEDTREVNEIFHAEIETVKRQVPAELNEEFFAKSFGPEVKTQEDALNAIRRSLSSNYNAQAEALLLRDFQERLMNENKVELPESFLKRWLKIQNDANTDEIIEKGFASFANNMRWTLIRSKILRDADVSVTLDDVKETYRNRIRGYFGGMAENEALVESLVERVINDEKQFNDLYEDAVMEKTFSVMKSKATILEKPISASEFESVISAARFEAAKSRGDIVEQAPAQEEVEA